MGSLMNEMCSHQITTGVRGYSILIIAPTSNYSNPKVKYSEAQKL